MAKQLSSIVMNSVNVENLRELILYSIDQDENFGDYIAIKKVNHGDPIGFIGDMNAIGKKGSGCDPVFDDISIKNGLKRWALGNWQAPMKLCYEDLVNTVAEYCLRKGTDIADITEVEFTTDILLPRIDRALKQMIWRLGWFGDTDAKTIANGGTLTNGTDTSLFTTCDGLWKRIFTQGAANSKQLTAIAANTKTTAADQKAEMLKKGVATDLVDSILMDADSRIVDDPNSMLLMTRAMADALAYDLKKVHNLIMPWEKVFDGIEVSTYGGVKIARVSIFDRIINAHENTGTKLNKPYRAVFANKEQLMVGCPADDIISTPRVWYENKERRLYIDIQGKLGTSLLEDDMFHAAY